MSIDEHVGVDGGRRFGLKVYAGIAAVVLLGAIWVLAQVPEGVRLAPEEANGETALYMPPMTETQSDSDAAIRRETGDRNRGSVSPAFPGAGSASTGPTAPPPPANVSGGLSSNWGGIYDDMSGSSGSGWVGGASSSGLASRSWSGRHGAGASGNTARRTGRVAGARPAARPERGAKDGERAVGPAARASLKAAREGDDGDTSDDILMGEQTYTGSDPPLGNGLGDGGGDNSAKSTYATGTDDVPAATTPEPATLLLMFAGGGAAWVIRRRRRT